MDNQKTWVRMAAFAASNGDLHADKQSFEARRWSVMPQQDGAFHLGRRLSERSRGKRKRDKSRGGGGSEKHRWANAREGHDGSPH
jgi:hypothetical protein